MSLEMSGSTPSTSPRTGPLTTMSEEKNPVAPIQTELKQLDKLSKIVKTYGCWALLLFGCYYLFKKLWFWLVFAYLIALCKNIIAPNWPIPLTKIDFIILWCCFWGLLKMIEGKLFVKT